ncbi:MAG: hypothetical protein CL917_02615 [Deltaproteobacteria bacterium]|nr:hypothetical protein [Deltaproteobacteria bacterium]
MVETRSNTFIKLVFMTRDQAPPVNAKDTLAKRFSEMVSSNRDAPAVESGDFSLSYAELEEAAAPWAAEIGARGGLAPIIIACHRQEQAVVGMVACMMAGRVWTILDPKTPTVLREQVLRDLPDSLVLTEPDPGQVFDLPAERHLVLPHAIPSSQHTFEPGMASSTDPICILYTSGSTGVARGVLHSHSSLLEVVAKSTNHFDLGPDDRIAMLSPLGHVVGTVAVLLALMNGGRLSIYEVKTKGLAGLPNWLSDRKITYFHTITTIFRRLAAAVEDPKTLSALKVVAVGGEAVTARDYELFQKTFPAKTQLRNSYGATESIDSFQYVVGKGEPMLGMSLPIGYPCSDEDLFKLMTEDGEETDSVSGELWVSSPCLALGYWMRPEDTATRFPVDHEGRRWFRSGDLCRMDDAGRMHCLGRGEGVVQLRGVDVDLNRIEQEMRQLQGVSEVVVNATDNDDGDTELFAFYCEDGESDPQQMRNDLGKRLPEYMVPHQFILMDRLPLTSSGKVDRRRLRSANQQQSLEHILAWREKELDTTTRRQPRELIVVTESRQDAEPLLKQCQELEIRGHAYTPGDSADSLPSFDSILVPVHAGFSIEQGAAGAAEELQKLLSALKELLARGGEAGARLMFITCQASHQPGQSEQNLNPFQTMLWGVARGLRREFPGLDCRILDMETSDDLPAVLPEFMVPENSDDHVMLRSGQRFVARILEQSTSDDRLVLKKEASYLITGGLGGLGLSVAEAFAKSGAGRLYLLGRSAANPEASRRIQEIERSGTKVEICCADISDPALITSLLAQMENLKGIVHLAGVTHFELFEKQDPTDFRAVLAPKLDGAWNLHQASLQLDDHLDFFVMSSSITALLGMTGHVDYAAANAFLDGLADFRCASGLPGASIDFGTLDGGMVDNEALRLWLQREGLLAISMDEAVDSILSTQPMSGGWNVRARMNWSAVLAMQSPGNLPFFSELADVQKQKSKGDASPGKSLEAVSLSELMAAILEIWATVLSLDTVDEDADFFELGGHSLALLDVHSRLCNQYSLNTPVSDFFVHTTARTLAEALMHGKSQKRHNALILLQKSEATKPLIMINSTATASNLAAKLPKRSVFSANMFRLTADIPTEQLQEDHIWRFANYMAEDIDDLTKKEGCHLLGFCQDSLLTVELGRALLERSVPIHSLTLIDAVFGADQALNLKMRLRALREIGPSYLGDKFKRILKSSPNENKEKEEISFNESFYRGYVKHAFSRIPEVFEGEIHLIVSSEWRLKDISGVEAAANRVTVHPIRSSHGDIFREPHLSDLASYMNAITEDSL